MMLSPVSSAQSGPGSVAVHPAWVNTLKPKGESGALLKLASGGKTSYRIVIPEKPTPQDKLASRELARWLKQITGADFPVVAETPGMSSNDPIISVGRTSLLQRTGRARAIESLHPEAAVIHTQDRTLFLYGGSQRGPVYAVFVFLEEDLGCRWYQPGTATIPDIPELTVRPVHRVTEPALIRREPYYYEAFDPNWALYNRMNAVHCPLPSGAGGHPRFLGHFVHTFNLFMSPDEFFQAHPEYYSEIDGQRNPSQLCMTHPDVRRIFTERVIAGLAGCPDCLYVDVSPNDWQGYCDCAGCTAIRDREGGYMGPLLDFVNYVAAEVAKVRPDVTITTLSYLGTIVPPRHLRPLPNVQIVVCSDSHAWDNSYLKVTDTEIFQNSLRRWTELGVNVCVWDYQYIYGQFMQPLPNIDVSVANLRFFVDQGVHSVFLQGAPHGTDRGPLRIWLMNKLMWNPGLDYNLLVRDFYFGYFGKAAEPMYAFDRKLSALWQRAYRNWKLLHPEPVTPDGQKYSSVFHPTLRDFDDEFIAEADALYRKAFRLADGDAELIRRIEYAYLNVLFLLAERGRTGDLREYLKIVNDLERIALANHVDRVKWFEGQGDMYKNLAMWRALAFFDSETTGFQNLSNEWRFRPDPNGVGIQEKWFDPATDIRDWGTVRSDLGHRGWESQGYEEYTVGYGWYRQEFFVPEDFPARHNPRLFFGAVDEQAEVWLNGQKALSHTTEATGMSKDFLWQRPFHFDPVRWLKPGETNTLVVRVHNSMHVGGIWKPVRLVWGETSEDLYILDEFFRREDARKKRAAVGR